MNNTSITTLQKYLPFVMSALMFCIPLGPSLKSIGVGCALLFILITQRSVSSSDVRHNLAFMFSRPFSIAAIGLCILVILACTWSIGSYQQQFSMVEKYIKLLYLPIFALGFSQKKTRYYGIQAFIVGMFITCVLSFYKYYYNVHQPNGEFDPGRVFYNHIVTGYMMATATYLAAWMGIHAKTKLLKVLYCLSGILFSIQIVFVNASGTGCMVYLLLLALLFVQYFHIKPLRYTILLFVFFAGLVIQQTHPEMLSKKIETMTTDIQHYQQGDKTSSVGFRLQFHQYAQTLFLEKPLFGHGTGSFLPHFYKDDPIPEWAQFHQLPNPHSQYWLIASELGSAGLLAWGCFFILLVWMSFRLQKMRNISQAILLPFFVGNFSDTFLVTSGIGYLFIVFMGLCLGEFVETHEDEYEKTGYPVT